MKRIVKPRLQLSRITAAVYYRTVFITNEKTKTH
jgi:hypothetical protein